jgi:geranylgeranyl diphosphate synthase type I
VTDSRTTFYGFLGELRPEIERLLATRWATKLGELARHGEEVHAMAVAVRDLTVRGGKRFRAALLAIAYSGVAPEAPLKPALDAGVALELFQTYLLAQDDWMDGDALRRGGPSVHAQLSRSFGSARIGESAAILASDLTWGMAFEILSSLEVTAERSLDVIRRFCRIHEDVVVGQALDLFARAEDVEAMHALKTGSYTVRGPLVMGAALAGANAECVQALEAFAAPLGVAFQLRDDVLGTFATRDETGKDEGGDLREGKRTAVIVEAERLLDAAGKKVLARVFGREQARPDAVREVITLLETSGVRAAVTARLGDLCGAAEKLAADVPVSDRARVLLAGSAQALRLEAP